VLVVRALRLSNTMTVQFQPQFGSFVHLTSNLPHWQQRLQTITPLSWVENWMSEEMVGSAWKLQIVTPHPPTRDLPGIVCCQDQIQAGPVSSFNMSVGAQRSNFVWSIDCRPDSITFIHPPCQTELITRSDSWKPNFLLVTVMDLAFNILPDGAVESNFPHPF